MAHGTAHDLGLQIADARVALDFERQAFRDQCVEDLRGSVARAMIDDLLIVDQRQVVPDEGLDDVGLVAQHRRAEELHCRWRCCCPDRVNEG
jgi:hypothetical protein